MDESVARFTSLTLAGYGWMPADWRVSFFPDDLPSGWHVSYYANEFKSVLLDAQCWGGSPLNEAAYWLDEVGSGFSFYVEITRDLLCSAHWPQVGQAVGEVLAAQVGGLVVADDALAELPSAWAGRFPVHRLPPQGWLAHMPPDADAQLGVVHTAQSFSPQQLRGLFEALQQHAAHRDVVLFMDTPYAVLEQVRLMQQVYGVWNTAG